MTTSPAFVQEMKHQIRVARGQLAAALAADDESEAEVAANRIADLCEIVSRATDPALVEVG